MVASSERQRLLITVLTYPHPSTKYQETVCTAAITDDGRWVRLYPIPLRSLPLEQRLRKWHWVDITTTRRSADTRPESRTPNLDTIVILEKLDPVTKREERRRLVNQLTTKALNEWVAGYEVDKTSLGVIVPKRVLDIEVERDAEAWSAKEQVALSQLNLFADSPKKLEKIPYRFRYVFEDSDGSEQRLIIRDWELGALYLKMRDQYGEDIAVEKVKEKYLNQMCSADKDTRFFIGTMYPYNQWMVIGVYWPPKTTEDAGGQMSMIDDLVTL